MSQNFCFLAPTVWDITSFEDIFTNHDLINYLTSNGGVCRTDPATLGLLKRSSVSSHDTDESRKVLIEIATGKKKYLIIIYLHRFIFRSNNR